MPAFFVEEDGIYLQYNYATAEFLEQESETDGYKPLLVRIMAYRQFIKDKESAEVKMTYRPITADYDELVSAARKIFPFGNNEVITAPLSRNSFEQSAEGALTPEDIWFKVILAYELKMKQIHREGSNIGQQLNMGFVNEMQLAAKAHLKIETQGATNHGPEVNNPYPEKLGAGKYPVFLPSGEVQVLESEQDICTFINEYRSKGFPLDVNPKWGWEINEEGDLYIPLVKFNSLLSHKKCLKNQHFVV